MALTKIAKKRNRQENESLHHRLTIGGDDFSDSLITATINYTSDVGGSGMEFEVADSLEDYEDAPVKLEIGYGRGLVPYFVGRVLSANDNETLMTSAGSAFGPFKIMIDQDIGSRETFFGKSLEWVVMELAARASMDMGSIEVLGASKWTVPRGELFQFDTTCGDVLSTLLEKAEFVAVDQPGGRRQVFKKPRPGHMKSPEIEYTPDDYISFSVTNNNESRFASAVVYRQNELGQFVVYAEQEIDNNTQFDPPKKRRYKVPDFVGSQVEASQLAFDLATSLRAGEKKFTLSAMYNPDLHLWDGFRAIRKKPMRNGKIEHRVYICVVDESITMNYSPGDGIMEWSGSCFELPSRRRVVDPTIPLPARNPGLLSPVIEEPPFSLTDDIVLEETVVLN